MYTLFNTSKKSLHEFLNSISDDDVRDCCSLSVFRRAEEYYYAEHVYQASYNKEKTSLKALVSGNDDYTVTVLLADGKVSGSCTCPHDDICKHIVATLLYTVDVLEIETEMNSEEEIENWFQNYLKSLSKEELIILVEKYSPERFRMEVKKKFANAGSAHNIFRKTEQNIKKIFVNNKLLNSYHEFNQELDNEFARLSGFNKTLQTELEKFLFDVIKKIDNAINNGELYEYENDNGYEPSSFFVGFVTDYVASLGKVQKTAFIAKLDAILEEQSYKTFEELRKSLTSILTDDELPHLKKELMAGYLYFSKELVGYYYDRVQHLLAYQEKVAILNILLEGNSERVMELANLMKKENG